MISRKLVDHTNIEITIGRILDKVYTSSVSMRDSIGSVPIYFHTSMVLHPGSDDHLRIRKCIHKDLLSSLLKENRMEKFH